MLHLQEYSERLQLDGLGKKTISGYMGDLSRIFSEIGISNPKDIDRKKLAEWDLRISARFKHNTRVRLRISIKRYLAFLHSEYSFPDLSKELKNIQTQLSDPYLLHSEDFVRILHQQNEKDLIEARDGAMFAFLAGTGVRREEITLLRMGDIYTASSGDQFVVQVPTGKHGGRVRIINFGNLKDNSDIIAHHFGSWYMYRMLQFGGSRSASKHPLFASLKNPSKPMAIQSINDSVSRAAKRANERLQNKFQHFEKITPHSLRHFFATQSRINGMALEAIQYYLGHDSIRSTERYIHLAEKATGDQALKFGATKGLKAKPTMAISGQGFADAIRLTVPKIGN